MVITDVRVRKMLNGGKLKAIASVTFDGEFVVHDVKIIEGQNGPFIAMPSRRNTDGTYRDVAHPLLPETRNRIKDAVFDAYARALAEEDAGDAGEAAGEFLELSHLEGAARRADLMES